MKYISNWFSNMKPLDAPFIHDGIEYHTSENFYQAMKVMDRDIRKEIAAMNPFDAKKCFREDPRKFVIRDDWCASLKLKVMEQILDFKFAPGTTWHDKLLATQDDDIVEYNNWGDVFWGVDVIKNRGSNHLGKILMKIRAKYLSRGLEKFMT
jgi:ribA/ribD-fused uncharacterized protein